MSPSVHLTYLFQMNLPVGTCGVHQNLLGTGHARQLRHFCPQHWAHQLHLYCSNFSAHVQCSELITLGWEDRFGFTKLNTACLLHVQAKLSGASHAICCSRLCPFWQFLANNVSSISNFKQLSLGMGKAFCYWSPSCTERKGPLYPGNMWIIPSRWGPDWATWPLRQYCCKSKCEGVLQSHYTEQG